MGLLCLSGATQAAEYAAEQLRAAGERWLTPGEVADFLQGIERRTDRDRRGAEAIAWRSWARGLDWDVPADGGSGPQLQDLQTLYRPSAGSRHDRLQTDARLSLWGHGQSQLLGQVGFQWQERDQAFRTGLAYRYEILSSWRLGANAFYDYLSESQAQRYSLGLKVSSRLLDLYTNQYRWGGGKTSRESTVLRADNLEDGWDVGFTARLPYLPLLEMEWRYYRWTSLLDKEDLTGARYRLGYQPVSLFGLDLKLDDSDNGHTDWAMHALLQYWFGVPLRDQLQWGQTWAPERWDAALPPPE